jgi:hypothetical protein
LLMKGSDVCDPVVDLVFCVTHRLAVKSDSSLLFKKLNELNSAHRIIMTGASFKLWSP